MATETTNLKLNKPDKTDFYNIDLANDNMDKIDKAIGEKANKTDIPTKLPANGGNADTLGGLSSSDYRKTGYKSIWGGGYSLFSYVLNDMEDNTSETVRIYDGADVPTNYGYIASNGSDFVFYIDKVDNGYSIIRAHDNRSNREFMIRSGNGEWDTWKEICDGGNAATLNGVNSRAFMQHYPYGTGVDLKSTIFPQSYSANINEASGTSIGLEASWWHLVYLPHDASGFGAQIVIPLNSHFKPKYRLSFSKEWQPWRPLNDNVFVQAVAPTSPHVNDLWIW